MKKRTQSRQVAMKCLFQMTLVGADLEEALEYFHSEEGVPTDVLDFARELAHGAHIHREQIDNTMRPHVEGWDYERIGHVEKAILRLAVYELLFRPDIPRKVTLNEAIELGKEFTTSQSVRFLNGVLDAVMKAVPPAKKSPTKPVRKKP